MKPTTLSEAVNRYLDIRRTAVAANTYKNDRVAMNALLDAIGANTPLRALSRELFEATFFGEAGRAHDTGASTFNAYLSRMRKFTQTALAYEWIDRDPLLGVAGRRRPPTPPRQRLSPAELLALVEAARSPRDRIAVAIAVNTGLRGSEIAALRVGDVNLGFGYLEATISKTGVYDKMPITKELERELVRWIRHYARWTTDGLLPHWFLVPQQNYSPRQGEDRSMDYKLIPHKPVAEPYDVVQRCLTELGLPTAKEGFHTIRRSVGRAYYDLMRKQYGHESALVATAALLHHADTRQTQHYIGVEAEKAERDAVLKRQPFLTRLVNPPVEGETVRHLRLVDGA
jgi:integrase